MNRVRPRLLFGFVVLVQLSSGLHGQSLQVVDPEGHTVTLTAAQIATAPRTTVNVTDHDKPATYQGVALAALLAAAGMPLTDKMKGPQLIEALLFEASDGYKVVFALAEIDPAFATREIILADTRDGKLLDTKVGPFRVIALGDKRGARWIRQVATMKIVEVK